MDIVHEETEEGNPFEVEKRISEAAADAEVYDGVNDNFIGDLKESVAFLADDVLKGRGIHRLPASAVHGRALYITAVPNAQLPLTYDIHPDISGEKPCMLAFRTAGPTETKIGLHRVPFVATSN